MSKARGEASLIGGGLLLFLAVSLVFILRSSPGSQHFPPLSSMSPRPNGAMALYDLLAASGLKAEHLLETVYHYPEDGCVVLLDESMPDPTSLLLGSLDVKALSQWLKSGGRLVLLASSYSTEATSLMDELAQQADSPLHSTDYGWATVAGQSGFTPPQASHVEAGQVAATAQPLLRLSQQGEVYEFAEPRIGLLQGVGRIEIARPDAAHDFLGTVLIAADDPPRPLVIWMPVGTGEVLWVTAPELAGNSWIQRQDNHRLLLNLLSYAARGGTLYFDEHFHGYRESSPNAFSLILHSPGGQLLLLLLGLFALAFAGSAISPARFLPQPVPPRRQSTEMVLAQGNLYQRAGLRRPIALHLLDGLRQSVRRYEHWSIAPDDARLAAWLHDAAARGLPVDPLLLQVLDGKVLIGSPRQLWQLAQACDKLRAALG